MQNLPLPCRDLYRSEFILNFLLLTLSKMSGVGFCAQAGSNAISRVPSCWPAFQSRDPLPVTLIIRLCLNDKNLKTWAQIVPKSSLRFFPHYGFLHCGFPHSLKFFFFFLIILFFCLVAKSCLTFLQPYGVQPAGLLCPWDSPGKNTGVGCHFLLQGIFLTWSQTCVSFIGRQILYYCAPC